jgi:hypothetical protein
MRQAPVLGKAIDKDRAMAHNFAINPAAVELIEETAACVFDHLRRR